MFLMPTNVSERHNTPDENSTASSSTPGWIAYIQYTVPFSNIAIVTVLSFKFSSTTVLLRFQQFPYLVLGVHNITSKSRIEPLPRSRIAHRGLHLS